MNIPNKVLEKAILNLWKQPEYFVARGYTPYEAWEILYKDLLGIATFFLFIGEIDIYNDFMCLAYTAQEIHFSHEHIRRYTS